MAASKISRALTRSTPDPRPDRRPGSGGLGAEVPVAEARAAVAANGHAQPLPLPFVFGTPTAPRRHSHHSQAAIDFLSQALRRAGALRVEPTGAYQKKRNEN